MRTIPLIRCLPKMSPSSSTSTGSQIATWRRSLAWTRHDSTPISNHCWRERYSSDCQRFSLNPVQRDILPHRQSQLSDLTIRLTLSPNVQTVLWQFNSLDVNHVTNHEECVHIHVLTRYRRIGNWKVANWAKNEECFVLIGQSPCSWRIPLQ